MRHPEAEDTVEGIAEWWLLEQKIHNAVGDVEAALSELVAKAFLVARQCTDGRTYYRFNPDREPEVRRYLENARNG